MSRESELAWLRRRLRLDQADWSRPTPQQEFDDMCARGWYAYQSEPKEPLTINQGKGCEEPLTITIALQWAERLARAELAGL